MKYPVFLKFVGKLLATLLATACAHVTPVEFAPPPYGDDVAVQSSDISFEVRNGNPSDIKIYTVRGTTKYKLGYVTGGHTQKVRFRKSDLDPQGCVVLYVLLFPASDDWVSDRVCVRTGHRMELWVQPLLQATSLVSWQ